MEYQKNPNLLDKGVAHNVSNQSSKFRIKNWIEINDESRETYSVNRKINFKTSVLRSSLCDYSDTHRFVKENISVNNIAATDAGANNTDKKVIFKICASFADCISKINNTQVNNAKGIDKVMPKYNLIEYSDNYSKPSGSLWHYFKDIPVINNDENIAEFNGGNALDSFNFKTKITSSIKNNGSIKTLKHFLENS